MKKKTFYFLFATLLLLSNINFSHAQTLPKFDFEIENFVLDKTSYNSGDEVVGSFEVKNLANTQESLKYDIALAGDYKENTLAGVFYSVSDMIEIKNVQSGETRKIDFKYNLPKGIGGKDMGIQIQFYNMAGIPILWKDSSRLNILEGVEQIDIEKAYIKLNKDGKDIFVNTGVGPSMYKDSDPSKLYAGIEFKGSNKGDYLLHPKIYITSFLHDNENVYTGTLDSFKVTKEKGKYEFELPNLNYNPGVYLAKVILMDNLGKIRSGEIFYRYVIAGNVANISDVSLSTYKPERKEDIKFLINYTGSPVDMLRLEEEANKIKPEEYSNISKIRVTDQVGNAVFEQEKEFISGKENQISFDYKFSEYHEKLNLYAEIKDKNGNFLDSFSKEVSIEKSETFSLKYRFLIFVDYALVLLILSAIGLFLYFKRRRFLKIWLVIAIIIFLIFTAYKTFTNNESVFADGSSNKGVDYYGFGWLSDEWNSVAPYADPPYPPNLCEYLLKDTWISTNFPSIATSTSQIYIAGGFGYTRCMNTPASIALQGQMYSGEGFSNYKKIVDNNDLVGPPVPFSGRTGTYSIGPFTTPYYVGEYTMSLKAELENGGYGSCDASFVVHKKYNVVTTAQCGQNAKTYQPADYTWAGNTGYDFCANGSVLYNYTAPTFSKPDSGNTTVTWKCWSGYSDLTIDPTCTATIPAANELYVSCKADNTNVAPGTLVNWSVDDSSGGSGRYKYEWSGNAYDGLYEQNSNNTDNKFIDVKVNGQDNIVLMTGDSVSANIKAKGFNIIGYFYRLMNGEWDPNSTWFTDLGGSSVDLNVGTTWAVTDQDTGTYEVATNGYQYAGGPLDIQDVNDFVYYNPLTLTDNALKQINNTFKQKYSSSGTYTAKIKLTDITTNPKVSVENTCSVFVCPVEGCPEPPPCPGQHECASQAGLCVDSPDMCNGGSLAEFNASPKIVNAGSGPDNGCTLEWKLNGYFKSCKINGVDVSTSTTDTNRRVENPQTTTKYELVCVDTLNDETKKEVQCIVNPSALEF